MDFARNRFAGFDYSACNYCCNTSSPFREYHRKEQNKYSRKNRAKKKEYSKVGNWAIEQPTLPPLFVCSRNYTNRLGEKGDPFSLRYITFR